MLPCCHRVPVHHGAARIALLAVAALVLGCRAGPVPGPVTPSPAPKLSEAAYGQAVAAFFAGVDGLDAGDNDGALARFQKVTELAPFEPAAWANVALAQLRRNDPAAADAAVTKARELAPRDGDIALLAALVKSRQGAGEGALAALKEAVTVAPDNPRARFALYQELARGGDDASRKAAREQLDVLLKARPSSPVALVESARLAARLGDAQGVTSALAGLASLVSGWSEQTRGALETARTGASGDTRAEGQKLAVLGNLLLAEPGYQQELAALQSPSSEVGHPLPAFLALPAPPAQPAPADATITMESQPAPDSEGGLWAVWWADDKPQVTAGLSNGILTIHTPDLPKLTAPGTPDQGLPPAGVASVDFDNDRLPDIAMAGHGGLKLYRQTEPGKWADVTGSSGLPPEVVKGSYVGVWPVDIDLEGDLDLVLGVDSPGAKPVVVRNNGDGTWATAAPLDAGPGPTDLAAADFDGDGDLDIAAVGYGGAQGLGTNLSGAPLRLFVNERSGVYRTVPLEGSYAAVAAADPDGNGRLDITALRADGAVVRWFAGADGTWQSAPVVDTASPATVNESRLAWADLDLNGAADLVASNGGTSWVWLTNPDGSLGAVPNLISGGTQALADLDGDGRVDVVGRMPDGSGTFWANKVGQATYHYQVIRPKAVTQGDQRVNSFGVGGQMTLRAGLLRQTQPIAGPAVHFGLGTAATADSVRVQWPNGTTQAEFDVQADQAVVAEQRLKGSCPWLFADDGTGQKFVTDILWKSPLGLRVNAQDTAGVAQTLDWVKVRGDQLKPRDGRYDLRVTAELWETHYFDQIALMTVGHPAGTEAFLDERFVIPPPPAAVVVTGPVHPVTAATDQDGRDVSRVLADRDERYVDGFTLANYQGLAADHWVELDLGPAVDAALADARAGGRSAPQLALVGFGWVYPTDSSINVALSQGKNPPPTSVSLEVPDGHGGWMAARTNQGFPAGKMKTSLFDLTGLDPAGAPAPRRLRLRTNLELYWDSLGVAEVRPDVTPATTTSSPSVADLRYRGFSMTNYLDPAHPVQRPFPEVPDYSRLMAAKPLWLDLVGYYTRFGDVRLLLEQVDDRYVILNAGDEIALSFAAPPDPPAGQVRDFVFVSDGWEKDGDFNTAYSETVQPLPSHDHPEYADPVESGPVGPLTEDPVYQRFPQDWADYHTRYVGPSSWNR
jgi:tetratricopeptide (TPR) repeat protein